MMLKMPVPSYLLAWGVTITSSPLLMNPNPLFSVHTHMADIPEKKKKNKTNRWQTELVRASNLKCLQDAVTKKVSFFQQYTFSTIDSMSHIMPTIKIILYLSQSQFKFINCPQPEAKYRCQHVMNPFIHFEIALSHDESVHLFRNINRIYI